MGRGAIVALLAFALAVAPAGSARASFEAPGTIQAGNPASVLAFGVTEVLASCDDATDLQGVDGFWVRLPDGAAGLSATLTTRDFDDDADVYFYTGDCAYIDDMSMAQGAFGEVERGVVPDGAVWAIVNLYLGTDAPFVLAVG